MMRNKSLPQNLNFTMNFKNKETMKNTRIISLVFLAFIGLASCTKNGEDGMNNLPEGVALKADAMVKVGNLPQIILDYVTENYPERTITKSEEEDNGHFEVKLSDGTELIFDGSGDFLGIDDDSEEHGNFDDDELDVEALLPAILEYVTANYPGVSIEEASMENNGHIELSLNDETVLVFNANGEFLGVGVDENDQDGDGEFEWGEGDHHDDGENINPADLPEMARAYLTETYPDLTILHAELESEGGYEVTMSNGLEVYFDAEGTFLSADDGENHSG